MTITASQLRRLTMIILVGCIVLLPALIGRASAQPAVSALVPASMVAL